jgi:hypothetical protein
MNSVLPGMRDLHTTFAKLRDPSEVKVLRVIVPQQRTESFVPAFVDAFQKSDWSRYSNGDDWP